jgi:hypothetical protein
MSNEEKIFATDQIPELSRMDEVYGEEMDKLIQEKGEDNVTYDDTVMAGRRAVERLKLEMEGENTDD